MTQEKRVYHRLPYIEGGAPGALLAFTGFESVTSILMSVLYGIAFISKPAVVTFITLASSVIGAVLSWKLWKGLLDMRKGDIYNGAYRAEAAVRGRRVLLWIAYAIILLLQIISVANLRGGNKFLALLITVLISLVIIIPVNVYYKRAELILSHIRYESQNGKTALPKDATVFSVLSVIFGTLIMIVPLVEILGPFISKSYVGTLYRSLRSAGIFNTYGDISNLILMAIYLIAARFFVLNICCRGFIRSHKLAGPDRETQFTASGLEKTYSICILASILLGWMALMRLNQFLSLNQYLEQGYFRKQSFYSRVLTIHLIIFIADIVLAIALMLRKGRISAGLIGIAGSIAGNILNIVVYSDKQYYRGAEEFASRATISSSLMVAFLVLVLLALLFQWRGKKLPSFVTILMIAIAVCAEVFYYFALKGETTMRTQTTAQNIMRIINELVVSRGASLLISLGLIWMTKTPKSIPEKGNTAGFSESGSLHFASEDTDKNSGNASF